MLKIFKFDLWVRVNEISYHTTTFYTAHLISLLSFSDLSFLQYFLFLTWKTYSSFGINLPSSHVSPEVKTCFYSPHCLPYLLQDQPCLCFHFPFPEVHFINVGLVYILCWRVLLSSHDVISTTFAFLWSDPFCLILIRLCLVHAYHCSLCMNCRMLCTTHKHTPSSLASL